VPLTLDPDRGVRTETCPTCQQPYVCVTGFVLKDEAPHAVYFAALHGHEDPRGAWLDVTFSEGAGVADRQGRVTFGCRIGDFGSHGGLGAALVDVALEHVEESVFGRRLTPDEAMADRRLEDFWAVVDLLLVADEDVQAHTHASA
jgi:hypothetical protein